MSKTRTEESENTKKHGRLQSNPARDHGSDAYGRLGCERPILVAVCFDSYALETASSHTECQLLPRFVGSTPDNRPPREGVGRTGSVESRGGVSPPRAPRTVRETLASHGSRCSATGTDVQRPCLVPGLLLLPVGLNNAAPSVQSHYRTFIPVESGEAGPEPYLRPLAQTARAVFPQAAFLGRPFARGAARLRLGMRWIRRTRP
jgi:hypothetical protein